MPLVIMHFKWFNNSRPANATCIKTYNYFPREDYLNNFKELFICSFSIINKATLSKVLYVYIKIYKNSKCTQANYLGSKFSDSGDTQWGQELTFDGHWNLSLKFSGGWPSTSN